MSQPVIVLYYSLRQGNHHCNHPSHHKDNQDNENNSDKHDQQRILSEINWESSNVLSNINSASQIETRQSIERNADQICTQAYFFWYYKYIFLVKPK